MTVLARFRDVITLHLTLEKYIKALLTVADKIFQMRLTNSEHERLIQLAEQANIDKTALAKRRIFSNEGIIILDNAHLIARSLIEISDRLRGAQRDDKLSDELINKAYTELCNVSRAFVTVSKELTDFKAQHEGGEE